MLEINKLSKKYNEQGGILTVLEDVSFNVKKGEVVCIVGPSGSGKSTLLKCLTGIDDTCEGSIKIDGADSADYLQNNRIALVSQKYSNLPWLTVYENVAMGFHAANLSKSETVRRTNELLKRVGLFNFSKYYVNNLSGGMQQRVAIARAIAQETDIIAFDEPFGALDTQTRSKMQDFLAELNEKEKKTIILVTHDIEEAIFLADTVYIFTESPARIRAKFNIPLNRPRKHELKYSKEFFEFEKQIAGISKN